MSRVERIAVSLEPELLKQFDAMIEEEGYPTRSEAVRALIRQIGIITIMPDSLMTLVMSGIPLLLLMMMSGLVVA